MNPAILIVVVTALVILIGGFYRDVIKRPRH